MRETIINFFGDFSTVIIFLHIISAIIWVGGMIIMRFALHYSMRKVDDPTIKLTLILDVLKRFFSMVIPSIVILLLTSVIMIVGLGFKGTDLYPTVINKEIIWGIMTFIFILIYMKRNKAQKFLNSGDLENAKNTLVGLSQWMIPLNIILGLVALYYGVVLRGF